MEGYSDIIKILTSINLTLAREETIGGVGKLLFSINAILDAQESSGRFRGYVSSIFAADNAISDSVFNTVLIDFNVIILNINGTSVLLSPEAEKIRQNFLNSSELERATTAFFSINKNYEIGTYNQSSDQIWDDATKIITYIQDMVSDSFNNISKINIDLQKSIKTQYLVDIIIAIITVILIIVISLVVIGYITSRIRKVTNRLNKMSEGGGDLTTFIDKDLDDEIGKLVNSFNTYILTLSSLISGIKKLTINFVNINEKFQTIISDVNQSKVIVSKSIYEVDNLTKEERDSIIKMKTEMDKVDKSTETLSHAVHEQTTVVEESSAAVEEMLANINTVSKNVSRTSTIIFDLSEAGSKGKDLIARVTNEINKVSELSISLKGANSLIADIADRTSLLSMNAAIEAAHAGEAGKGFAVVADEIRNLSESTTSQSKGITDNLNQIISGISTALASSVETESTFSSITEKIENVAQNQEQIKNAMMEQNEGSTEILEAVTMLKDNNSSVDEAVAVLTNSGVKMLEEEDEVFRVIKKIGHSVNDMNSAVEDIETLLATLTESEKLNSELVSELSTNMDLFKV